MGWRKSIEKRLSKLESVEPSYSCAGCDATVSDNETNFRVIRNNVSLDMEVVRNDTCNKCLRELLKYGRVRFYD